MDVAFSGYMLLVILFISSIFAVGMSNLIAAESVVFDVYNATVIFMLFNDIFYSSVALADVSQIFKKILI